MRLSLSRLTALLVIGLAFAAIPGVVVARMGSRDAAARMTRGGFHRLGSSDAALHVADDHDPDTTPAGDVVGTLRLETAPAATVQADTVGVDISRADTAFADTVLAHTVLADTVLADTARSNLRQPVQQYEHAPPGPPGVRVWLPRPVSTFVLLDTPSVVPFHPAFVRSRPAGRAPPTL